MNDSGRVDTTILGEEPFEFVVGQTLWKIANEYGLGVNGGMARSEGSWRGSGHRWTILLRWDDDSVDVIVLHALRVQSVSVGWVGDAWSSKVYEPSTDDCMSQGGRSQTYLDSVLEVVQELKFDPGSFWQASKLLISYASWLDSLDWTVNLHELARLILSDRTTSSSTDEDRSMNLCDFTSDGTTADDETLGKSQSLVGNLFFLYSGQ